MASPLSPLDARLNAVSAPADCDALATQLAQADQATEAARGAFGDAMAERARARIASAYSVSGFGLSWNTMRNSMQLTSSLNTNLAVAQAHVDAAGQQVQDRETAAREIAARLQACRTKP